MTRKLTVNGKRKLLTIRVSEPVFAAVQQAAGATGGADHAQWVRDAVYAALDARGLMPDEGPPPAEPAPPPVPAKRVRKTPRKRGGYEAGDMTVSDLPPPPASVTVPAAPRQTQTRGQKALHGPPASKPAPPPPPPPARALRPAHAPGAVVFQDLGGEAVIGDAPPAPAATRTKCNHRIFRVFGSREPSAKGVSGCCPECGHSVLPGGYWEPECDAGTCGHPQV